MYRNTLIASIDMIETTETETGTQIPVSEDSGLTVFTSPIFIVSASLFVLLVLLFFIFKPGKADEISTKNFSSKRGVKKQPQKNIKKQSSLSTPSNIKQCIKSFLENTKENYLM